MMWFIPENKKVILSLTAGLCLSIGFMTGCKEEAAPAPKPAVVKQRIEQPSRTTNATEAEKTTAPAEAAAVPKASEKTPTAPEAAALKAETPAPSAAETASSRPAEADSTSLKSSLMDDTFPKYDPAGKIDPFTALFSKENETDLSAGSEPKRPLTPLEKIDISQLKLVAVLLAESGNRAMVEDATGKPYILTPGTYVGVNSGTVSKILKDRVVIEEKTKDFLGRERANTRELKLQKPFGEE